MLQTSSQIKKGYSLVEAIVYVALLSVFISAVTYASSSLLRSFSDAKDVTRIETSAIAAMDRMIREIRSASSVDTSSSCLYDPPFRDGCDPELGVLKLNKMISGSPHSVRFYISNGQLMLEEDGVLTGPITSSRTEIQSLRFRHSVSTVSEALKIQLAINPNDNPDKIENFYDTAVLRGSYQ